MEVAVINTMLGRRAGVLELVFGMLPPRDMKNVVLVCHLWREVGEAPGFLCLGQDSPDFLKANYFARPDFLLGNFAQVKGHKKPNFF